MKNKEKFQKELADIAIHRDCAALTNGKPVSCLKTPCEKCDIGDKYHCVAKLLDWAEDEYKEPLLDDKEKAFLQYLVNHIRPRIVNIKKLDYDSDSEFAGKEYINFLTIDDLGKKCEGSLPDFDKGTMYKGLDVCREKPYTLAELGLKVKK